MKNIMLYIAIAGAIISCIAFNAGSLAISAYLFVVSTISFIVYFIIKCLKEKSFTNPFGSGPFGSSLL